MGLIQGGPPEWIWERTANLLKWELQRSPASNGAPGYELRVSCGLEIMRLQFFTSVEMAELHRLIGDELKNTGRTERGPGPQPETVQPGREPGTRPAQEPGNRPAAPEAERP